MRISRDLNVCLKGLAHLRSYENAESREASDRRGQPMEPDGLYLDSLLDSVTDSHREEATDRRMNLTRQR
jgi:hypothetical protein